MGKRFLLFGLLVFLGLSLSGQRALAKLKSPENLRNIAAGEGSAKVGWDWDSGGGTISKFVISYRVDGESGEWKKVYPSASLREYTIMGLTENTTYEWKIMTEASDPSQNSDEAPSPPNKIIFTTSSSGGGTPPPGGGTPPPGGGGTPVDLPRPISAENLDELFADIINFFFILSLGIGPLMIVYAGFLMLTAGGDPKKVTLARTIILWTLIALAVIFFAKGLTSLVKGALGG